jgi:hypothetical protein
MIILVKINKTYRPGIDPKICAKGAWVVPKYLKDIEIRRNYRYLVAYANKRVLGVYCITGYGEILNSKIRKVYFDLLDMDPECEATLINALQHLVDEGYNGIVNRYSVCLLGRHELRLDHFFAEKKSDCCPDRQLEELAKKPWEDPIIDQETTHALKSDLWYRMTVNYDSFDSFRVPHFLKTNSHVILSPNGRIRYERWNNFSGTLGIISTTLDSTYKRILLHIFGEFERNPKNLYDQLDRSHYSAHIAHTSTLTVTVESFSDKGLTRRVKDMTWSGNVIVVHKGILKSIFEMMVF